MSQNWALFDVNSRRTIVNFFEPTVDLFVNNKIKMICLERVGRVVDIKFDYFDVVFLFNVEYYWTDLF